MSVLLTGGGGYIGSHVAANLLENGETVVIVDNEITSTGHNARVLAERFGDRVTYSKFDVCDQELLAETLKRHSVRSVIHLAGLKSVGESVEDPLLYLDHNLRSALSVLGSMKSAGVDQLLFSSSATVYGEPQHLPLDEEHPRSALNAYGQSKLMIEEIIERVVPSVPGMRAISLRYFNPIGFHSTLELKEDGPRLPDNLVPHILAVLDGRTDELAIFGNDYATPDGTALRDYLHVQDVAEGHAAALRYLAGMTSGVEAINLGRGSGVSVAELVEVFERVGGREVPKRIARRRAGDAAVVFANPEKARTLLGWVTKRDTEIMVRDSLRTRLNLVQSC